MAVEGEEGDAVIKYHGHYGDRRFACASLYAMNSAPPKSRSVRPGYIDVDVAVGRVLLKRCKKKVCCVVR